MCSFDLTLIAIENKLTLHFFDPIWMIIFSNVFMHFFVLYFI